MKLKPLSVPTKSMPGKSVHAEKRLPGYNIMQNTGHNPAGQNPYGQNHTRQNPTTGKVDKIPPYEKCRQLNNNILHNIINVMLLNILTVPLILKNIVWVFVYVVCILCIIL